MTCELCDCVKTQPPSKPCCDACGKSGKCCGGGPVSPPEMPYDCEGGLLDGPRWLAGTGLGASPNVPALDAVLQNLENDATACNGTANNNVTAYQQAWNAAFPGAQITVSNVLDADTIGAINSYLAQIGASWTWTCVNGQFAQGPAPAPPPMSSNTLWGAIAAVAGGAAALAALWLLKKPAGPSAARYATRRRRTA